MSGLKTHDGFRSRDLELFSLVMRLASWRPFCLSLLSYSSKRQRYVNDQEWFRQLLLMFRLMVWILLSLPLLLSLLLLYSPSLQLLQWLLSIQSQTSSLSLPLYQISLKTCSLFMRLDCDCPSPMRVLRCYALVIVCSDMSRCMSVWCTVKAAPKRIKRLNQKTGICRLYHNWPKYGLYFLASPSCSSCDGHRSFCDA